LLSCSLVIRLILLLLAGLEMWIHHRLRSALAFAAPLLFTRNQPQERSHDKYLRKVNDMLWIHNQINVTDPVFGLVTDSSASAGRGNVTDVTCLQMAIADVAYTNAKQLMDLEGMVASLIYRTLERNTNGVGIKSRLCTTMTAVNPEIGALVQHQDPASDGAADHNRAVVLELARQISLIGGNATLATDAGTFAPGPGNICDDPNCIYEQNRLQMLVSDDEIASYVGQCVSTLTVSVTVTASATQTKSTQAAATQSSATSISSRVPPTSSLGGPPTDPPRSPQ